MKIKYKAISHKKHRYSTVGDYWVDEDQTWQFRVSKMGNEKYELLVFFHEFTEALLCDDAGIRPQDVDAFDIAYESAREDGEEHATCGCPFQDEPGDDVHAPYHKFHIAASSCERLAAQAMGVNWTEYEEAIVELFDDDETET